MNRLYDYFMEDCVITAKQSVPDGLGGHNYDWVDSEPFPASIVKNNTMEAKIAEKQGVTEVYTVTVQKGTVIKHNDIIKRLSDGATFRVTSNTKDSESPSVATFGIGLVTAERWDLTND